MEFFAQSGASVASDAIISVFTVLLTLFAVALLIIMLCRFVDDDGAVKHKVLILLTVFAVGAALRLGFGLCIRGYRDDYAVFTRMIDNLRAHGLSGYFDGDVDGVLYPVVYFVYLIFGGLANVTGLSSYDLGMQFTVKLPLIIADLLAAFAVYLIADRYFNKRIAIVLCAFVNLCPIFFMGSSVWCTPIVFTAMFGCFACYFLARKNHICALVFFTVAAYSSREGVYLIPVAGVFAAFHFVRAVINIKRDAPQGKALLSDGYVAAVTVPIGVVVSTAGAYLIGLFMILPYDASFFGYIYDFLLAPFVVWKYFTVNGLSVYSIFGQNGATPGARFPSWVFALMFTAIITAVVCVVYFSKRNRATLVMLAAYSMFTMQIYYPGSGGAGMQSALILLLAAYALVRDKRLLHVLFVAGLAYVVNIASTLSAFGYLNNLADFNFGDESIAVAGAANVITVICAVLTLLAHLYFTVVTVNVGMTGHKKCLMPAQGFGGCLKEYFSVKKG